MANTMSGGKLFICVTPQNNELTKSQYDALVWVQVKGIGSHGETGTQQNVVGYDTWDLLFQQKAKGIANAGDPEVEIARIAGDAGQVAMRAAAAATNPNNYAFKIERNDAPSGGQPTKFYNRGVVTGPRTQHGRNENFDLEMYTIGCVQEQITVEASPINITNTPANGKVGTAYTFTPTTTGGTTPYTYMWYGDNLATRGMTFNGTTGALTAATPVAGTLNGVITVTDAANLTAILPVAITIVP